MCEHGTTPLVDDFFVASWQDGTTWFVALSGDLDLAAARPVAEGFERATSPCERIVVDAGGVTFVDARGLGILMAGAEAARREVWLRSPSPWFCRLAEIVPIGTAGWRGEPIGLDIRLA